MEARRLETREYVVLGLEPALALADWPSIAVLFGIDIWHVGDALLRLPWVNGVRSSMSIISRAGLEILRQIVATKGYVVRRGDCLDTLPDLPAEIRAVVEQVRPVTSTTPERIAGLCLAVEYVVKHQIPGDFVECGVWKGGSTMAAALSFLRLKRLPRLHLFDTYEGMSEPTEEDVIAFTGERADELLVSQKDKVRSYSPLDEVKRNMEGTRYPSNLIRYIKGRVEDTLPAEAPAQICILRLDTDWYESTKHELVTLFPNLTIGGVLLVDDYGFWRGARKAVDEYFEEKGVKMLLNRLDFTGRIGIKSV